jgi:tyrosyl-tRNA synthetase
MFGKVMSIPDELVIKYYRLCTPLSVAEVDALESQFANGTLHPNSLKRRLGREIVALYHNPDVAISAEEAFDRVFKQHQAPEDIPEIEVTFDDDVYVPGLLQELGLVSSAGDGRRMIDQGGVKLDGVALEARLYNYARIRVEGHLLQVGKRRYARPVSRT